MVLESFLDMEVNLPCAVAYVGDGRPTRPDNLGKGPVEYSCAIVRVRDTIGFSLPIWVEGRYGPDKAPDAK